MCSGWFSELGVVGVWLAMICDWFVRSAFFAVRFRGDRWTRRSADRRLRPVSEVGTAGKAAGMSCAAKDCWKALMLQPIFDEHPKLAQFQLTAGMVARHKGR